MKPDHPDSTPEPVSREAVHEEVARILASEKFGRSKKLRRLLQFTVEQTLEGHADTLKEYVIGTEVLKKPETYDPRRDSLVRVMASRLRTKLKEYYNNGGSEDPLVIELPKGQYVPRFQSRESVQTGMDQKLRARHVFSHAKFLAGRFTEEALAESAQLFEEAIEADPGLMAAHSGLANVRAFQAFLGLRRPSEIWPAVKSAARAALAIDEMGSEAHRCLGMEAALFEWRWEPAESHFKKAIETDPYASAGHLWHAVSVLIPTRPMAQAQAELAQARELAPHPFLQEAQMLALFFSGQYDALLDLTEPSANTGSGSDWPAWMRGLALAARGWLQAAVDLLSQIDRSPRVLASLGYVYGLANQPEQARSIAAVLNEWRGRGVWIPHYDQALIETGSGNPDRALALLKIALDEREPWLVFLRVDPRWHALRGDPQFSGMIQSVFPDAADRR